MSSISFGDEEEWHEGDLVRVTHGLFDGFSGKIAKVDLERSMLRMTLSIFGKETVIELAFMDVERE